MHTKSIGIQVLYLVCVNNGSPEKFKQCVCSTCFHVIQRWVLLTFCKFLWKVEFKVKPQHTKMKLIPLFLRFEFEIWVLEICCFNFFFIKCDIIFNFSTTSCGKKSLRRILFLRCALMAALGGSHRQEVLHNTTNGVGSKYKPCTHKWTWSKS